MSESSHHSPANTTALKKSLINFVKVNGKSLSERSAGFYDWVKARESLGVWPYSRVLMEPALHHTVIANEYSQSPIRGINFASQDYLGLAFRPELRTAAHAAIDTLGIHSAGSPALCGRTQILLELEHKLSSIMGYESCLVYPTGWAAGFGVVTGLIREADTILIDTLCHSCLQEGARHATSNVRKFAHNDLDHLQALLEKERGNNPDGGIFIVIETLYSMDSDSPDIVEVIALAHRYDAIVILDVAHDFGAMGEQGLGLLERLCLLADDWRERVVIMGSFSKTFAANGGFVVSSAAVRQYLRYFSASNTFSNAISPIQTQVVHAAFDIVFSTRGQELRKALRTNINLLRNAMQDRELHVAGTPSPIVPVFTGGFEADEPLARLTSRFIKINGLHANLCEFPAVPRNKARFRFQVMATHERQEIDQAADILLKSRAQALAALQELSIPAT